VPESHGGPGATVTETFRFIIDLASVDANVAQSLRSTFLFVERLLAAEPEAEREQWFPRVLAGDVFGNAGWERGGRNGEIRARLVRDGEHFLANGTKSYSTGALFADWVSSVALDHAGEPVSFTVPRGREGLELLDDWDGVGQRLTASGTTEFRDMVVYGHELRRRPGAGQRSAAGAGPAAGAASAAGAGSAAGQRSAPGQRSAGTAFAQLYLAAVLAGIARDALRDAVVFAREHARPIVHSAAERSVDDLYVQQAVGEISARAFAARAAVLSAAQAIDLAVEPGADEPGAVEPGAAAGLLTSASVDVAQAQLFAAEAALRAGELAFEVGGASATLREHNLDRHWRNARTVANHNPRAHKARVIGAYHLTGAEPPTSGLF
jgi:alkylation response protein AidB-like acyl-CoA dehydrogenase